MNSGWSRITPWTEQNHGLDSALVSIVILTHKPIQPDSLIGLDLELLKQPLKMPWSRDAPGTILRGASGVSLGAASAAITPSPGTRIIL